MHAEAHENEWRLARAFDRRESYIIQLFFKRHVKFLQTLFPRDVGLCLLLTQHCALLNVVLCSECGRLRSIVPQKVISTLPRAKPLGAGGGGQDPQYFYWPPQFWTELLTRSRFNSFIWNVFLCFLWEVDIFQISSQLVYTRSNDLKFEAHRAPPQTLPRSFLGFTRFGPSTFEAWLHPWTLHDSSVIVPTITWCFTVHCTHAITHQLGRMSRGCS